MLEMRLPYCSCLYGMWKNVWASLVKRGRQITMCLCVQSNILCTLCAALKNDGISWVGVVSVLMMAVVVHVGSIHGYIWSKCGMVLSG